MSYLPNKKTERWTWGTNFGTQLGALATKLGIPTTTVASVTSLTTAFGTAINTAESAKAAAKAATQNSDSKEDALFNFVRPLVQELQRNPAMTDEMRAQLGITVPEGGRTPVTPKVATDLLAIPNGTNNSVNLKWKRNGNPNSVVFIIETKSTGGTWSQVWAGTKSKATLTGFTAGETAWFRVIATAGSKKSLPSNEASIYGGEGSGNSGLSLAA